MFIEAKSDRKSAFESRVSKEAKKERKTLLLCTQPWSFFTVFGPNSSTTFWLKAVISSADASIFACKKGFRNILSGCSSEANILPLHKCDDPACLGRQLAFKPKVKAKMFSFCTSVTTLPACLWGLAFKPQWKLRCFPFGPEQDARMLPLLIVSSQKPTIFHFTSVMMILPVKCITMWTWA